MDYVKKMDEDVGVVVDGDVVDGLHGREPRKGENGSLESKYL